MTQLPEDTLSHQLEAEIRHRVLDLVQGLNGIVWEKNALTGEYTFMSDRALKMLGYPANQWRSHPHFWQESLIHSQDQENYAAFYNNITQKGQWREHSYRAVTAKGKEIWLKDVVRLVRDGEGNPQLLRGITLDITQEKQAEENRKQLLLERTARRELESLQSALSNREERYRTLVEATADIIWNANAEGEIVSHQPTWSAFTGQTQEELEGWGWLDVVHPEDQAYTAQVWSDAVASKSIYKAEYRLKRFDGEYRYMNARGIPILEADETVREWIGVNTDITESKHIQQARDRALSEAQSARAELQRVFMQVPAAISISTGENHVFETINQLYIKLIGKKEVIGRPMREVFSELEGQGFFELMDQVYATGEPFVGKEMRAVFDRNGDGQVEESFWNFVYQPLFDYQGQVYGIMAHAVEVTEQVRSRQEIEKKAEELMQLTQSLERINQELDQFAYVTSHDLKAPLRAIANLSQWLEEDLGDILPEESREQMNLLRGRVHRMEDLINGILHYSRAGRTKNKAEEVNVADLLSDVLEMLSPAPEFKIDINSEMPTLMTERVPLEQVFMNLISNAIKYTQHSDPKVLINARDIGNFYEFSIADNGPGIAPEYQERIWRVFQRLEARDKIEGAGIGLSVVKKIVESRGGEVWLTSEVGKGTTFYFTWRKG